VIKKNLAFGSLANKNTNQFALDIRDN